MQQFVRHLVVQDFFENSKIDCGAFDTNKSLSQSLLDKDFVRMTFTTHISAYILSVLISFHNSHRLQVVAADNGWIFLIGSDASNKMPITEHSSCHYIHDLSASQPWMHNIVGARIRIVSKIINISKRDGNSRFSLDCFHWIATIGRNVDYSSSPSVRCAFFHSLYCIRRKLIYLLW